MPERGVFFCTNSHGTAYGLPPDAATVIIVNTATDGSPADPAGEEAWQNQDYQPFTDQSRISPMPKMSMIEPGHSSDPPMTTPKMTISIAVR